MPAHLEIITTGDGSHTIRDSLLDVTYHSQHGAITESRHVFIEHGLCHFDTSGKTQVRILEIGFGTGLNGLLALQFACQNPTRISYTALEPSPLPSYLIRRLNYPDLIDGVDHAQFIAMHSPEVRDGITFEDHFDLKISPDGLNSWKSTDTFDLVFLDAFGPKAAPELWSLFAIKRLKELMVAESILVTFCAQGQFKRDLRTAGFQVESLPGPPGKREMVRATLS